MSQESGKVRLKTAGILLGSLKRPFLYLWEDGSCFLSLQLHGHWQVLLNQGATEKAWVYFGRTLESLHPPCYCRSLWICFCLNNLDLLAKPGPTGRIQAMGITDESNWTSIHFRGGEAKPKQVKAACHTWIWITCIQYSVVHGLQAPGTWRTFRLTETGRSQVDNHGGLRLRNKSDFRLLSRASDAETEPFDNSSWSNIESRQHRPLFQYISIWYSGRRFH